MSRGARLLALPRRLHCSAASALVRRLEEHAGAEKEEFEERQKQLEGVVSPIMTKLYSAGGAPGGGAPGGFDEDAGAAGGPGPKIEVRLPFPLNAPDAPLPSPPPPPAPLVQEVD